MFVCACMCDVLCIYCVHVCESGHELPQLACRIQRPTLAAGPYVLLV